MFPKNSKTPELILIKFLDNFQTISVDNRNHVKCGLKISFPWHKIREVAIETQPLDGVKNIYFCLNI